MKILKQILNYLFWIAMSFTSAYGYMWILIGPTTNTSNGFIALFEALIYFFVMIKVVPIIGSIIAFLYILIDIFYLKKKLENNSKRIIIRFLMIILITLLVGIIHYILEKVIDVI